jgi:predicted DCC family thiol-disulfide oxidoreductase YuxK
VERAADVAPPAPAYELTVLYDGECGFCKVILATLLSWDRAKRLAPAPIQSTRGERLLFAISPRDRLASWHLVDAAGDVRSGGAGIPLVLAVLPRAARLARVVSQFPKATSRAYDWVADHRALLGRALGARPRAWAARVIAARERL